MTKAPLGAFIVQNIGDVERSRTSDLLITNQLLYQLSYNGTGHLRAVFRAGRAVRDADSSRLPGKCSVLRDGAV